MKLKDIKLETCPFCDGERELLHNKLDDGYIYSEAVKSLYGVKYVLIACKTKNFVTMDAKSAGDI